MGAYSVTGIGNGGCNKPGVADLSTGPAIMIVGMVGAAETVISSPPTLGNTVTFQEPLVGSADSYAVFLSPKNAETAYITDMNESGGYFTGFDFNVSAECDVMYMVVSVGSRK